jgi:hypothetical protein
MRSLALHKSQVVLKVVPLLVLARLLRCKSFLMLGPIVYS